MLGLPVAGEDNVVAGQTELGQDHPAPALTVRSPPAPPLQEDVLHHRVESHGGPGEEVGALAGPDAVLLGADHGSSRGSGEVEDRLGGGDSVGGHTAVLAEAGLGHVGELEGELVSGQPGDGEVRPGGEAEAGGPVPGQVDPAYCEDTAEQGHLQSGGVHRPGGLDGDLGRVQDQQGAVAGSTARPVARPAGVEPAVPRADGGQQEAPVPAPLHLHGLTRPAPGDDRPGVAGARTAELGQSPRGRCDPGRAVRDPGGGGEEDLVGLNYGPAAIVHQALVDPGISRPHLQHLQQHRARHQPDCEKDF